MPLSPTETRFKVDSAPLTGFTVAIKPDLSPKGLTSARVQRFPGSTTGYAIKGTAPPPMIVVPGMLRAENYDALFALVRQYNAWVASTGIVTVTLHETTYTNCTPMSFQRIGQIKPYSDDGGATVKAQAPARFVFEQLQEA